MKQLNGELRTENGDIRTQLEFFVKKYQKAHKQLTDEKMVSNKAAQDKMNLLDELADKGTGDGLSVLKSLIQDYKVKLQRLEFKSREQEN